MYIKVKFEMTWFKLNFKEQKETTTTNKCFEH